MEMKLKAIKAIKATCVINYIFSYRRADSISKIIDVES